jgi:hypothetical protein
LNDRLDNFRSRRENRYRHPRLCIISNCIISIEKKERVVVERDVEKNSMYRSFELIYGDLNQTHGVMIFSVYTC